MNQETMLAMRVDDMYQELREVSGITWDTICDRLHAAFGERGYEAWVKWELTLSRGRADQERFYFDLG